MSAVCPAKQCGRPARGGWCAGHRKRWERYGDVREDIPLRPRGDIAASFWPKVDRRADGECWPWLATVNRKGYGQVEFLSPVDLTDVKLGRLFEDYVAFEERQVTVYPDPEKKPPVGSWLSAAGWPFR